MLRNKKLFAILTLAAFIMTLLPVVAFAADASRYSSILRVDKETVEANGDKDAEFTVYVRDSSNNKIANAIVYVASERGLDADNVEVKTGEKKDTNGDKYMAIETDNNGKAVFEVTSSIAGEAEIAVGLNDQVYGYLTDSDVTSTDAQIIGKKTITFEATDAEDIELVNVEDRDGDDTNVPDSDDEDAGDREYGTKDQGLSIAGVKANGSDYYELTFAVSNSSNAPVEGENVEFSANKSAVRFNVEEKDTDEVGEVTVKVYADKADTYEIEAALGSKTATVYLAFAPSQLGDLEVVNGIDELVAIDEDKADSFKLELKDANGNKIDPATLISEKKFDKDAFEFEWITKPEDSDLEDDWAVDSDGALEIGEYAKVTEDDLLQVYLPELDEEGDYKLKVNLENGKSAYFEFEGREQGDVEKITIEYDESTIQLGSTTGEPTVRKYDADGVGVDATTNNLDFTVNDYKMIEEITDKGAITATEDDDYTGELVVTVIDNKEGLTASTTVTIGKDAVGLKVETPENVVIGEETPVKLSVKDRDGNVVGIGAANEVDFDYYVLSKPEGAKVSAEERGSFVSDLKENGTATVDVLANKEGKVAYTFVVTVTKDGDTKRYAKSVTVNFVEKAKEVEGAAKNVTMFIGANGYVVDGVAKTTDLAPFIQDNRTFVPVRMVGEALGAEVDYDQATQTVTLAREDKTITLTIGQNTLTVSDGSVIVSDVAAFIKGDRTVLPFRAIGEAFGADVEAVFNADGTVNAVTFAQK